jgi:hypothetical protein
VGIYDGIIGGSEDERLFAVLKAECKNIYFSTFLKSFTIFALRSLQWWTILALDLALASQNLYFG